jgi:hypothetical protein
VPLGVELLFSMISMPGTPFLKELVFELVTADDNASVAPIDTAKIKAATEEIIKTFLVGFIVFPPYYLKRLATLSVALNH